MGLSKRNQQLRRELKEIARLGEEATLAIWMVAKMLQNDQATALMDVSGKVHDCIDRVNVLAVRVKAGEVIAEWALCS